MNWDTNSNIVGTQPRYLSIKYIYNSKLYLNGNGWLKNNNDNNKNNNRYFYYFFTLVLQEYYFNYKY